ncbi:unnamed protein product [Ectocarpus sp. CCAP 1310/34]|nr:unnamed protein product [Ectocarpus sp. CCAP 1310/34]
MTSPKLDARGTQGGAFLPLLHEVRDLEQADQPHQANQAQHANQPG